MRASLSHHFKCKTHEFTSPEGISYTVDNLPKFCVEHDLSYESMGQLSRFCMSHYRGWRQGLNQGAFHKPIKEYAPHYAFCHVELTAPDGTNHTVTNLYEFCKEHGLNYRRMVLLSNGKGYRGRTFHYNGWRLGHDLGEWDWQEPLDEQTIQRLVKLYPSCTVQQLADRFDIHITTVRKYLKKYNVYVHSRQRRTKLDAEQIERVRELAKTCTREQIAARYNISANTVRRYLACS